MCVDSVEWILCVLTVIRITISSTQSCGRRTRRLTGRQRHSELWPNQADSWSWFIQTLVQARCCATPCGTLATPRTRWASCCICTVGSASLLVLTCSWVLALCGVGSVPDIPEIQAYILDLLPSSGVRGSVPVQSGRWGLVSVGTVFFFF
jgi:hypothetical protein